MSDSLFDRRGARCGLAALVRRASALLLVLGLLAACSTAGTLDVAPPAPPVADDGRYAAIVVDASSGKTLYEVSSRSPRFPASLTKMMTLYMLFEAMEAGRVDRTTLIPVSAEAARQPPTKINVRAGSTLDVDTAIRALAVKSANDVAVAVGEFLGGGSQDEFARRMTARARSLGMTGTVFRNASGLPDPDQRTTARDMALLGLALRQRFPQYYSYFSATSFTYRGHSIKGHNDLLGRVEGVDGIKTGYIRASGYNIVSSVQARGKSLVIVVMGGESARARNDRVEQFIQAYLPPPRGGVLAGR